MDASPPVLPPRPRLDYPPELPVSAQRMRILAALAASRCVVLTGETGSGKTTQLPKLCYEAGYGRAGAIVMTQPRRLAAVAVAERLREECGLDEPYIAHAVRFDDRSRRETLIRVSTDGLLLAEAGRDGRLSRYDCVIIDEAHERSTTIDVLLGRLLRLRRQRPELGIIISSATLDAGRFATYLADGGTAVPVVSVAGRLHPVDIIHRPPADDELGYLDALCATVRELHDGEAGDILCFLPTERDILEARRRLEDLPGATVVPCYGRLNRHEQQAIFHSCRGRKVVLATNIAETSLTVPGIRFVVDTGLAREKRYHAGTRTERLPIAPVARSSLAQRAGRAGRLGPGTCIRLFPASDAEGRSPFAEPELRRCNLAGVQLQLLAAGLGRGEEFPWIDAPTPSAWQRAVELLDELGALHDAETQPGGPLRLSQLGRRLANVPADPAVARILLAGVDEGVAHEACTIAAFLSVQDPRQRPPGKESESERAQAVFRHEAGDLGTLLKLWDAWQAAGSNRARERFCTGHFLSWRRMREWADVRHQLWQVLRDGALGRALPEQPHASDSLPVDRVHRSVLAGMLGNVARHDPEARCYRATANREAHLHPGSALRSGNRNKGDDGAKAAHPPWIVACELVETSRLFARLAAPIDPAWIEELAAGRLALRRGEPHYDPPSGRVVIEERLLWKGLELRRGKRGYGPIDPEDALRIFAAALGRGLADGALPELARCRAHIRDLPERLRDRTLHDLDERLAAGIADRCATLRGSGRDAKPVSSLADLNRLMRAHGPTCWLPDLVDLLGGELAAEAARLPGSVRLFGEDVPLRWRHAPGSDDDGATLRLPAALAGEAPGWLLERLVPGLVERQILAYLERLPRETRARLGDLRRAAGSLLEELLAGVGPLAEGLGAALAERLGQAPRLDPAAVPAHARLRLELVDERDRVVWSGRDLALASADDADPLASARNRYDTPPGLEWPDDELPERIPVGGRTAVAVLLRDRDAQARVCARRSVLLGAAAARAWHADGVLALLEGRHESRLAAIARACGGLATEKHLGAAAAMLARALALLQACDGEDLQPRNAAAFAELDARVAARLDTGTQTVPKLLKELLQAAAPLQQAASRGLKSLAALAQGAGNDGERRRLLMSGWWERLSWPAVVALPRSLTAVSVRKPLAPMVAARREALLDEWEQRLGRLPWRLIVAAGEAPLARRLRHHLEELLAALADGRPPPPGLHEMTLRQELRALEQRLEDLLQRHRQVLDALRSAAAPLQRAAGPVRDRLLAAASPHLDRPLDLGHGADPEASIAAIVDLTGSIRRFLG